MPVKAIHLSADAFAVCLTHALSTEKEEIMGLLIGEVSPEHVSYIAAVILLRRSCIQADRVEISPEQLSAASTQAENYGKMLQRPMRVVGWYHSHPHITVWPSHIDVRTQADYQLMDDDFIGLIFSIFNHDKNTKMNRVQVSCFQSTQLAMDSEWKRVEVQLHIDPSHYGMNDACIASLVDLPFILREEEEEAYSRATKTPDLDLLTCLHNGSVYTSSMMNIDESMYVPLLETMEQRLENRLEYLKQLQEKRKQLKSELKKYNVTDDAELIGLMV